jgi:DNA-binding winged helix-turn-helix (wHTH) protein/TolB-like protein
MDTAKRPVYEFGDFILEGAQRRLSRRQSGTPIALTPKAFDTLVYLVEHRGETLDKDTLLEAIWPGVVVEENSLTQSISTLRQVLGESPGANRYIATVPRRGYRFVGAVREAEVPGLPSDPNTGPREPIAAQPQRSRRPLWMGAAAIAILGVAVTVILLRGGPDKVVPAVAKGLVVLPFRPLLPGERDESLELGMTESMIASLAAHPGLAVRPLSSVRRYGSLEQDPLAAGRALNADAVLDGSLQHHGDQLRVSVRLLRVADGRQLWANQYEGTTAGIFGVQERIATSVSEALLGQAGAAEVKAPALGGTTDSTAYLLYASGSYALARSVEPSLVLGINYFEQAIARDPNFALAHVGVANCYVQMGIFGMRSPSQTFPHARDAVLKALQIEPRLAAGYAILGHIKLQYDRDFDGAEADFRHAIALDPSLAEAHLYWGVLLSMRGELERGMEEIKQAQRLAPLLTVAKTRAGSMLYFAHRYDEAIAQLNESIALDDRPGIAHSALGRVYLRTGRYDLALAEFAKSRGPVPGSFGDVGQALALSGHREEAVAELNRVLKLSTERYVSAVDIAAIYASLGDTQNALSWLERALQERASTLGFLAQNPAFDALHGNPQFDSIVERVGVKRPTPK